MPEAVLSQDDAAGFAPERSSIRNVKLAQQVASDIAEEIFRRHLAPGVKLASEKAMLEQFSVSRGTLREALRILEVQGLILVKAGPVGGVVVADMTAEDFQRTSSLHYKAAGATVKELWEARLEVEPALARLAAERSGSEYRMDLNGLLESARRSNLEDDDAFLRIGSDFHRIIARASCNRILDLTARSFGEMTAYLNSAAVFPDEDRAKVHRDHMAIARAILAGNANRAEKLMREHMRDMLRSHAERFAGSLNVVLPYVV